MRQVAEGVWQLANFPPHLINAYLVEDTLIDAGTRWSRWSIIEQLKRRPLRLVALTHCHPDHQGAARAVCEAYQVPLACPEGDVAAMEGRAPMEPNNNLVRFVQRACGGPPYPVTRILREGDQVAGFRVILSPGHTWGHVVFFRDSDRVAIAGDLLANIHVVSLRSGLRLPPRQGCVDARRNLESVRMLAELRPSIVCFGHGPPLRDARELDRFVAKFARRVRSRGRLRVGRRLRAR